jgi:type IV fimbrial biogenesis protein FimT
MRRPNQGFTLLEALITLAVMGILLGVAVPALADMLAEARRISAVNAIVSTMNRARHTAVTERRRVTVCPSGDGIHCNGEWGDGWILWAESEPTRHRQQALRGAIRVAANRSRFRFNPHGLRATNGTLVVCASGRASAVVISHTGRVRTSRHLPDWADCGT